MLTTQRGTRRNSDVKAKKWCTEARVDVRDNAHTDLAAKWPKSRLLNTQ